MTQTEWVKMNKCVNERERERKRERGFGGRERGVLEGRREGGVKWGRRRAVGGRSVSITEDQTKVGQRKRVSEWVENTRDGHKHTHPHTHARSTVTTWVLLLAHWPCRRDSADRQVVRRQLRLSVLRTLAISLNWMHACVHDWITRINAYVCILELHACECVCVSERFQRLDDSHTSTLNCNKWRLTDACVSASHSCVVLLCNKVTTHKRALCDSWSLKRIIYNVKWFNRLQKRLMCVCLLSRHAGMCLKRAPVYHSAHTHSVAACYLGSAVVMVTWRWQCGVFSCARLKGPDPSLMSAKLRDRLDRKRDISTCWFGCLLAPPPTHTQWSSEQ